jgi:hypothetical protein
MKGLFFLVLILVFEQIIGQPDYRGDDPVVSIYDTVVAPGELLLRVDALNFTGDNGQISAITLNIEVDTCLLKFIEIENIQVGGGSWLANYNSYLGYISIMYSANFGTGQDINGKLFDLHLFYNGGFNADLHIKSNSEFTNVYLQTIENVNYVDGVVEQITPVAGVIYQDTLSVPPGINVAMPVIAKGNGYDAVSEIKLRVDYDESMLEFLGVSPSLLDNIDTLVENGEVKLAWQNDTPVDLTGGDTLFFMNFKFLDEGNSIITFMPCSRVYNNGILVSSWFGAGMILTKYRVDLFNNPVMGGVLSGGGEYFAGDQVTISAKPNTGYDFVSWTKNDSIISTDSLYTFIKEPVNDTIFANYAFKQFAVTVVAVPVEGGIVSGDGIYQYADTVNVQASPNEGYDFVAWVIDGDTVSFDNDYSFQMPLKDVMVQGIFKKQAYMITAVPNDPAFGSVNGAGTYFFGDTVILIAKPNEHYKFVSWTENGQEVWNDSLYSFVASENRALTANFALDINCSAPTGLWADSLSYSEAMLHWVPTGDEMEWELIWGETGFDTTGQGTIISGITENKYLLTGLNAGTIYDFYVKAICQEGFESSWSEPFTFTTWYVGVNEHPTSEFMVYPNPAKDHLYIKWNKNVNGNSEVSIVDASGKQIYLIKNITRSLMKIPLSGLRQGIYFLRVKTNDQVQAEKFVITD